MNIPHEPDLRPDHRIMVELIEPRSKVLDLGCGDGTLLAYLIQHKGCHGTGIEIDEEAIYKCMAQGLSVSHGNIDTGLNDYSDKRFDYVILSESIQQVLHPQNVILESCRVGKKVIVGIPNFCHITARVQIFFRGRVPVTRELPYQWYDTPNLRFFSLKDFHTFCRLNAIQILQQKGIGIHQEVKFFPNLLAHIGIFLLKKNDAGSKSS